MVIAGLFALCAIVFYSSPAPPASSIRGQFKDANVEGLEYRTSGGRTGVTDSEGMFDCEEGGTVTFSVGGVEIGTSDCKLIVTPVDLVPGGSLDSAEVKNIVRFLLVLDEDADRSNGIKISESVRQAARGWNLDFSASGFASSIDSIVEDIAQIYEDDDRAVTDEDEAENHLRQTLQCSYSGVYTGTFSGDDRGRFGVLVDSRTGAITVVSYSTMYNEFSVQVGTRAISPENGRVTFSGSRSDGDGGFEGHFTSVDTITGSWRNEIDEDGTFSGSRIGSDRDAKYRVTGFWRNPSDSEDYGFFAFDVDGQGQLTGVGYSVGEARLFRADNGTANISLGSLEAMAAGETIIGTLHQDGRFSGTATESGQAAPSDLNGSWCQLNHGPDDSGTTPEPGPAPADQAAFDILFVGKQMFSDDPSYYLDFGSPGRFRDVAGADIYTGHYTYENTAPDSGQLDIYYDDGDRCTLNLVFDSATTGTITGTCYFPDTDESEPLPTTPWQLVEDISPLLGLPDLVVELSVSDSSLNPGQSFTLSATVRNRGNGHSAEIVTWSYFLSSDPTTRGVGFSGYLLDGGLAAGESDTGTITHEAPSSAGTYYYSACVDSVSRESNTGNNCSSAVLVRVGESDTDDSSPPESDDSADCYVDQLVGPGESCTYPGTSTGFSVDSSGRGHFLFITAGQSINLINSNINGLNYTFAAENQGDGVWRVVRVGS